MNLYNIFESYDKAIQIAIFVLRESIASEEFPGERSRQDHGDRGEASKIQPA